MLTFRPSFPNQMTQGTGKRSSGAAAATHAVKGHGVSWMTTTKVVCTGGVAAAAISHANIARHSRRIATQKKLPAVCEGRSFWCPRVSGPTRNSGVIDPHMCRLIHANWSIRGIAPLDGTFDEVSNIYQALPQGGHQGSVKRRGGGRAQRRRGRGRRASRGDQEGKVMSEMADEVEADSMRAI